MIDFLILEWLGKSGADTFLITSEVFLLIFAAVVAIGVLGETTKAPSWQPWHHAFGIIVFIGVAGEMMADAGVFISSARLQEISDHEITDAQTKAGNAIERAAILEKEAAKDRERSIEAQRSLEIERIERLKLQKKFAWRHLDENQLKRIIVSLLPFQEIPFDAAVADSEALNLLSDIVKALRSPAIRWVLKPPSNGSNLVIRLRDGVVIGAGVVDMRLVVSSDPRSKDIAAAASTLAAALSREGIEAVAERDANAPLANTELRLHLKIGSKPAF